jgi:hypothetical protein
MKATDPPKRKLPLNAERKQPQKDEIEKACNEY